MALSAYSRSAYTRRQNRQPKRKTEEPVVQADRSRSTASSIPKRRKVEPRGSTEATSKSQKSVTFAPKVRSELAASYDADANHSKRNPFSITSIARDKENQDSQLSGLTSSQNSQDHLIQYQPSIQQSSSIQSQGSFQSSKGSGRPRKGITQASLNAILPLGQPSFSSGSQSEFQVDCFLFAPSCRMYNVQCFSLYYFSCHCYRVDP
jgi:hypothetical protein